MLRWIKRISIVAVCAFALLLYREWVKFTQPRLFLPLGLYETALSSVSPEEESRDPATWKDPIEPVVMDAATFDAQLEGTESREVSVDALVVGGTFGGWAAAIGASEDGAETVLVTENEWRDDVLTEAGMYVLDGPMPALSGNDVAYRLRRWPAIRDKAPSPGTPNDVAAFFDSLLQNNDFLDVLSGYAIVAFGAGDDGTIERALLRRRTGEPDNVVVRTSYVLDGTHEGKVLALAGVPTRTGWEPREETGETGALPRKALLALAEGYSMSGRTVVGIGNRLDGARESIAVFDRGYAGTFVAPTSMEPCWTRNEEDESKRPFIDGQAIMRTRSIGCAATMRIESSFQDTVEIFFINHGNDGLSAEVALGSGGTLNIRSLHNPKDPFVRIGAFTVGPLSPITVRIASVLPTDRLEGVIVRKLNAGAAGPQAGKAADADGVVAFDTAAWNSTWHDVYAVAPGPLGVRTLFIDGKPYDTRVAGPSTYVARVALAPGTHGARVQDGDAIAHLSAIPIAPHSDEFGVTRIAQFRDSTKTLHRWTFTPDRDTRVAVTAPPGACRSRCVIRVTESGSTTYLSETTLRARGEYVATTVPIGVIDARAGTTYIVVADDTYDSNMPPSATALDVSAILYGASQDSVWVSPLRSGNMYDVWIRSVRAENALAIVGGDERVVSSDVDWRYLGTEPLSARGAFGQAGGGIEVLAVPNPTIDAYLLPLYPQRPAVLTADLPGGTYALASFGPEDPKLLSITHPADGRSQSVPFDGTDGEYRSTSAYVHDAPNASVGSPTASPQQVVFYERLSNPDTAPIGFDAALTPVLAGQTWLDEKNPLFRGRARSSSGLLLLDPDPAGISPVMVGTLDAAHTEARLRFAAQDAYLFLKHGNNERFSHVFRRCNKNQPTCDPRRFALAMSAFGTDDALPPSPTFRDVRRLIGRETLTASGAFVRARACLTCVASCVPDTIRDLECVFSSDIAPPTAGLASFPGTSALPNIESPQERATNTLASLLRTLRRDGLLESATTYLEARPLARDVTVTLGMVMPERGGNVLSANATLSATHQASRALRSSHAQLTIGSAVGHAVAFAVLRERAPLDFVHRSPDASLRLQQYLIDKNVVVLPLADIDDDPMLKKAVQRRVMLGQASVVPTSVDGRVSFAVRPMQPAELQDFAQKLFGTLDIRTVGDLLRHLAPEGANSSQMLRYGLESGFLNEKYLRLTFNEISQLDINEQFLVKAEYIKGPTP